jgi:hypothetical protein
MPDALLCGLPHYTWPETVCTEPAGHYRPDVDPHAAPLIIDGRHCGGCAWDEPAAGARIHAQRIRGALNPPADTGSTS